MSTEEEKIKADAAKFEAQLTAATTDVGTWVKVHYVWIAAAVGVLIGFVLGRIV